MLFSQSKSLLPELRGLGGNLRSSLSLSAVSKMLEVRTNEPSPLFLRVYTGVSWVLSESFQDSPAALAENLKRLILVTPPGVSLHRSNNHTT